MHTNNELHTSVTLSQACEFLSISTATGRNWVKSGRLIPSGYKNGQPFFEKKEILQFHKELSDGSLSYLKSRRNKNYRTGTYIASGYIERNSPNHEVIRSLLKEIDVNSFEFSNVFLQCALRFFAEQLMIKTEPSIQNELLNSLIAEPVFEEFLKANSFFKDICCTYVPNEDTLGFFYLSLKNLADRKSSGSYYTPAWLAKKLITEQLHDFSTAASVLDPSCGTGCFLLQLPSALPLENIHGYDIDPISIAVTRINLAIKYHISTLQQLHILNKNITLGDFLSQDQSEYDQYDIILGNPPWGAKISKQKKNTYEQYLSCAAAVSPESCDLFIEKSIRLLSQKGKLSFVLPEAVLAVKSHTLIRTIIHKETRLCSLDFLGEVFEHVHCPSILMTIEKNEESIFYSNARISQCSIVYSISVERLFQKDFPLFLMPDKEYLLLQKLLSCPSSTTLVDKSVFALGIVTGNNSDHIYKNPAPGLEPIIKGCDINRYHINSASGYIHFDPEQFQQTALESSYRAPEKLVYRFINKQLTFAYDTTGLLTLNSCNILIPQINGLSVKYVMAVLNSGIAQFIFEKCFHSIKVLRSHLEQIPIPMVEKEKQQDIISYVDRLLELKDNDPACQLIYKTLDQKIAELYQLSKEEYELIVR